MQDENRYGYPPYGQPSQQTPYGYPPYGQPGMGYGMAPFDPNGRPIPNRFGMKLTFSILEMLCCAFPALVCGIVGCVYTVMANASYRERRWEDFKRQARVSAIALWIGFGLGMATALLVLACYAIGYIQMGGSTAGACVRVDGTRIDIPTDYQWMIDHGFYLAKSQRTVTLRPGDYWIDQMYNDDGKKVMWCWFYNDGTSYEELAECDIIGVNLDVECDRYWTFQTSEGLGFDSTPEEFIEVYGEPDEADEDSYYKEYHWYLGDGDDPVWRVIEASFVEDELYEIDVDYKR